MRWGKNGRWVLFERFVIGPENDPYMVRWRLIETPWFRVFLHKICRSDDDRHLHDHPFNFISIILRGGYWEFCEMRKAGFLARFEIAGRWFRPGNVILRLAHELHRIEVGSYSKRPAWTLVLAGRRIRKWGFQTEQGWVPFDEYAEAEVF